MKRIASLLLFVCSLLATGAEAQILSIQAQDSNGNTIQTWNSGRWVLQCGTTLTCTATDNGGALLIQATGSGTTPGGANYSIQYNVSGASLGGVSGNGLVLDSTSAAPTIIPLWGTEGYVPTITNSGTAGDAVLFGSAGLVDAGFAPLNAALVGVANGVAPLDGGTLVPVANLPLASNTTFGVVKPGAGCSAPSGVLTCTGTGLTSVAVTVPSWLTVTGSPLTANGTIGITATSEAAKLFLASPNGSAGAMAPRAIVASDIPTLNQSTTGNAATATALAGTPTLCPSGQAPTGILASGNATGCAAVGGGTNVLNTLPFDLPMANTGNTANLDSDLFIANGTNTPQAAVNAAYANNGVAVLMPSSGITPFTNANNVPVDDKAHPGAKFLPITNYGAQCDNRGTAVNLTLGSKTASIYLDFFYSTDQGKTLVVVGNVGGVPTAFETVIQTVPSNGSSTATMTTASPFNLTVTPDNATLGHDDTAAMAKAQAVAASAQQGGGTTFTAILIPGGQCLSHATAYQGVSMAGLNGSVSAIDGFPGEDIFASPDPALGTAIGAAGVHVHDMTMNVDTRIDATLPWQIVNDSGTISKPALYRPACIRCVTANNPVAPGWFQGSGPNNSGAYAGISSVTAGSATICTPTAIAPPSVGASVVFPYLTSVFTTTVLNTGGTCAAGSISRTLNAVMPAGSTGSQVEWWSGTSPQTLATSISGGACPATITLTNSILPNPSTESNVAPYGLIQIDGEQMTYFGKTDAGTVGSNFLDITGCAQNGTSRAAHSAGATVVSLNPFKPGYPWPVTPTVNGNDTTPAGTAAYYPSYIIGNAAFAFPDTNGNMGVTNAGSFVNSIVESLFINGGYPINHTAAFYMVGLPYSTHFRDIVISGTYFGIEEGTPSLETGGTWAAAQPTADGTHWDGIRISSCDVSDLISGTANEFSNWNVYSQCYSQALSEYTGFQSGIMFTEGYSDQTGAIQASQTSVDLHNMYEENETGPYAGQVPANQWDLNRANWDNLHLGSGGEIYIGGLNQMFIGGNFNQQSIFPAINYGFGNGSQYTTLLGDDIASNSYGGSSFINYGANAHFSGTTTQPITATPPYGALQMGNSRQSWEGQSNETFNMGNITSPFVNSNGGYIPAWEFNTSGSWESLPFNIPWFYDASSPSGSSVGCTINTTGSQLCQPYRWDTGGAIIVGPGQRIVPGKYSFYIAAKSTGAATSFQLAVGVCTFGDSGTLTIPVSASYQIYGPYRIDMTGKSCLGSIGLTFANSSPANDTIYVGFVDFAPVAQNLQATAATIDTLNSTNITLSGLITDTTVANGCAQWTSGVLGTTGIPCGSGGGGGSGVTSVAMTVPSWLTITGSPITGVGTLALTSTSEPSGEFLASPAGSTGAMVPRNIVPSDIPTLNQNTTGSAGSIVGYPSAGSFVSGGIPYGSSTTTEAFSALLANNALMIGGGAGLPPSTITAATTPTFALFATAGAPAFRAITPTDIPTLNQSTTGNAATATSAAAVNGNTYPGNAGFVSGGMPYFSSTSSEGSTALLGKWGVLIGGGAGQPPTSLTVDNTTTHALFATAGAPAFRAMLPSDLPIGSATQLGGLECGTGVSCASGVISVSASGNTTSSTLTANTLPMATGANSIGNSLITTDTNGDAILGTGASFGIGGVYLSRYTTGTFSIGSTVGGSNGALQAASGFFSSSVQVPTVIASTAVQIANTGALNMILGATIALNGSNGTSGQCIESQGAGLSPVWGSCASSSGGLFPSSGIVFATSPTTSTSATSAQLVTALNTGISSTLSASLFPTLNQSTTGNAATASALSGTPTLCPTGQAPTGILPNGNATGCAAIGGGGGGSFGALTGGTNTSMAAVCGTGCSITTSGSGSNNASLLNSNTYPVFGGFTQGGMPWYSAGSTESSTALLARYGVMIGGGTGNAPSTITPDTNTAHALFATATSPAFRAITPTDIPTLNQNTTGSAGSLSAFEMPTFGNVASASQLTFSAPGGYAVITGTTTVTGITPAAACVGGSVACTYVLVSSNGFSFQVGITGGSTNNINGPGGSGSLIFVPAGTSAYVTYDPINGLWHAIVETNGYDPIYTHTLTGAAPTLATNSAVVASQDVNYLTMSANVTSITLPASTSVADGELLTLYVNQPASGSPFTVAAGTAQSVLTAGAGTTVVNTVPGGCPTIGTTVSSSAPSQLIMNVAYRQSLAQYQIMGCQTVPAQTGVSEASLTTGWIQMGTTGAQVVLAGTVPSNAGHFTNLQIIYGGGTCTTAPFVNIFEGNPTSVSTGTSIQGSTVYQAPGYATNQPQTLAFPAGANIGVETWTAGTNCNGFYMITAQYAQP